MPALFKIAGTNEDRIVSLTTELLDHSGEYEKMAKSVKSIR
jgi:hypothetical protein